jgi:hypothetical protein
MGGIANFIPAARFLSLIPYRFTGINVKAFSDKTGYIA